MSRSARLAVAGLIVLAAACVAVPLRKKDSQPDPLAKSLVSAPNHQRIKSSVLSIESRDAVGSESPASRILDRSSVEEQSADQMPKVNGLGATLHAAHPEIPANFPGLTQDAATDEENKPSESATLEIDPVVETPNAKERQATPSLDQYRIVDGDTLESIAQRLLGSAARAGEIYAANRGDLDSPELLPIGLKIVIPSAPAATPNEHIIDPITVDSNTPAAGNTLQPIPPIGS